jgi:anti-sigma B factor antagonist
MEVRVTNLNETPLIEAQGDIDHSTCGSIEASLGEVLKTSSENVLIDLSQVTYIDSGGLSVLLSGVRQMRDRGTLGVIGPNKNVQRLLEIVGLLVDPSFQVYEDRESAAAALERR